jgi:hypothetical protein
MGGKVFAGGDLLAALYFVWNYSKEEIAWHFLLFDVRSSRSCAGASICIGGIPGD